ncbi:helix-turn-helix transcriptional regulator [Paraflavitalea speifideaquila]|uniref:helix-turn-helix transcriptional regulator n=1 Tax=Paraflavitalea speifideaquila TaxID=3076558 RepID=UPI0028E3A748|nr:helix-turn-helix transcriptional regulator [Paraflavitalea speifideiaquila]
MDKAINERFKEVRKQLFKTQEEMAQALDVSQGTITDIERQRIGVSKKSQKSF